MKRYLAASFAALVAACSPSAPMPAAPNAAQPAAPPVASAKRVPLPDCATLAANDDGSPAYKDCRLMSGDAAGLAFEARFSANPTPGEAEHIVTIQVVEPGDHTLQTLSEKVEGTIEVMQLQDLDGDGYNELLIPLSTGNVNTNYAIWQMPGGARQFIRAGELSGFGLGHVDKFVTVNARSAANIQNLDYYTLENAELKHIAQVEFTAEGDPDKPTVKCAVIDGKADDPKGGLEAAGLTMKTATAKWCTEKSKKDAF